MATEKISTVSFYPNIKALSPHRSYVWFYTQKDVWTVQCVYLYDVFRKYYSMDLFSSSVVFRAQPNFLYSQALSSFFGKYYSGNKPRRRASLSALAGDSLGLVQQRRHLHSFIENRSFDFAYSADIHRRTDNGKGILEN